MRKRQRKKLIKRIAKEIRRYAAGMLSIAPPPECVYENIARSFADHHVIFFELDPIEAPPAGEE